MADGWERGHCPADLGNSVLRHLPDHHGVPPVASLLMAQNCAEAPDDSPANKLTNPVQELFFLQAERSGQGLEGGRRNGEISLNLADQFFIICRKLHRIHDPILFNMTKDVYDL